jgi:hypothetical protein
MKGPCLATLRDSHGERLLMSDDGRFVYFGSYQRAYQWAEANGFNRSGDTSRVVFADEAPSMAALKAWCGDRLVAYSEALRLRVFPIDPIPTQKGTVNPSRAD